MGRAAARPRSGAVEAAEHRSATTEVAVTLSPLWLPAGAAAGFAGSHHMRSLIWSRRRSAWLPAREGTTTSRPPVELAGCSLGRLYLVREGDEVGLESLYQGDVLIDLLVGVVGHLGEDNLARRGRWWLLGALG